MARSDDTSERSSPRSFLGRMVAATQNAIEIARFGGLGEREASPYAFADEGQHHRLRRYFPDAADEDRPPAILVPPLMLSADVWDVSPESSAVAALDESGVDPWVVDFGSPEAEEGGLHRTLTDHVVAVSQSVDAVRGALPIDLSADVLADLIGGLGRLQSRIFPDGIPAWVTRIGFQLLDPVKTVRQRIEFASQLYDREALQEREGMRRFLESEGWTAFPGPALKEFIEQLLSHNRMLQGGFVIDEHSATLASITCPILAFTGDTDSIAPAQTVHAIRAAAPRAESYEVALPGGHFALVVGSRSMGLTWPSVADWIDWLEDGGTRPEQIRPIDLPEAEDDEASGPATLDQVAQGLNLAWNLGVDALDDTARLVSKRFGWLGRLSGTIAPQLPRLGRLDELRRDTPINLGLILAERVRGTPDGTFFLFEGRAHSYHDANERVDNVVRGFVECGVRQGQYVGVLMSTRPSAVVTTLALSRLGAIPVMLRVDVSLADQLESIPVDHLVADPEHAPAARAPFGRDVLVLGGGGDPRALEEGLVDMEAIDPDRVQTPDWFVPNPGLAGELALVLITGDEGRLAINRVTNRRLATSAYGTALACALTPRDTAYCVSPIHHATGILVCIGGALVSGARLAMAEPGKITSDVARHASHPRERARHAR